MSVLMAGFQTAFYKKGRLKTAGNYLSSRFNCSRGLGDVYKRQLLVQPLQLLGGIFVACLSGTAVVADGFFQTACVFMENAEIR